MGLDLKGSFGTPPLTQWQIRAWALADGNGTAHIDASNNFSSLTDNGTGDYTFTYTNNHDDTTPSAQCTNNTEGNYILICHATTTTTIRVRSRSDSTSDHDDTSMFTIHGELA